jgi:hypothetical protein
MLPRARRSSSWSQTCRTLQMMEDSPPYIQTIPALSTVPEQRKLSSPFPRFPRNIKMADYSQCVVAHNHA